MRNVTIALEEELIQDGRAYAAANGTTLNGLIRQLLTRVVRRGETGGVQEAFALADRLGAQSSGPWKREELYDR